jgi:hypothetical protein
MYKADGFEVLAFPCNQFGDQEPGIHFLLLLLSSLKINSSEFISGFFTLVFTLIFSRI